MVGSIANLHVRVTDTTQKIALQDPPSVIAADRLNYALSTGSGVNVTVLNAAELLDRQNQVIVACGKSRSGIPSSVTTSMLSIPYLPDERVPLIRPDTLQIVYVRRQHIVSHELAPRGSSQTDVFVDDVDVASTPIHVDAATTPLQEANDSVTVSQSAVLFAPHEASDSEGDEYDAQTPSINEDIAAVRLQNRSLRKRKRNSEGALRDQLGPNHAAQNSFNIDIGDDTHASSFRPSLLERRVHSAIVHPALTGKNPQATIESVQQAPDTTFLATPPVLRALYDFSFGLRGLSIMHLKTTTVDAVMKSTQAGINMTNFSRSNSIQPPPSATSIDEIVDALGALHRFATGFFNDDVCDFIAVSKTFMSSYSSFTRPDATTCEMLVYWLNSKFGKFRSQLIASGMEAASRVANEFTRHDNQLMELQQAQQETRITALLADNLQRPSQPTARSQHTRESRQTKSTRVPHDVVEILPNQGGKKLCLRYLSKKGCTGSSPGKCYASDRAQFRPLALPADAKRFIDNNFGGLASEFHDL